MECQYALKPALWQTSLFRLQNVKLMMTTYFYFHCYKYILTGRGTDSWIVNKMKQRKENKPVPSENFLSPYH